jgi:hypothetical protein
VAFQVATSLSPGLIPSRSTDSGTTSAVSSSIATRARLPSTVTRVTVLRTWFSADASAGSSRERVISHGATSTATGPSAGSGIAILVPMSRTTWRPEATPRR